MLTKRHLKTLQALERLGTRIATEPCELPVHGWSWEGDNIDEPDHRTVAEGVYDLVLELYACPELRSQVDVSRLYDPDGQLTLVYTHDPGPPPEWLPAELVRYAAAYQNATEIEIQA